MCRHVCQVDELRNLNRLAFNDTAGAVQVTDDNKEEYVNLLAQFKMTKSVQAYIHAFCDGLWSCISLDSLRVFSAEQLGLLISGRSDISVKEMQVRLRCCQA